MKLQFQLEYFTHSDEALVLNVMNGDGTESRHTMMSVDGRNWHCELVTRATVLDYYYAVRREGNTVRREWTMVPHHLELMATKGARYTVCDRWIDMPADSYLYSSAFTECFNSRPKESVKPVAYDRAVVLKVRASQLGSTQHLAVTGSCEALGYWNLSKVVHMTEQQDNEWMVALDGDQLPMTFEFKFVVLDDVDQIGDFWEEGGNRMLTLPLMEKGAVAVYELSQAWFPIYPLKAAGTVIPVFSLRSEGSFGVGDFGDLKLMVDWCSKTRQRVLQILPINDTNMTGTWKDSYPYNSISIYALHPQYCDLRQLPPLKDESRRQHYETLREELNALPQIDYERMFKAKTDYLHELFVQEWPATRRKAAYKHFIEQNSDWLEPYARFCVNRDRYGTADFSKWPADSSKGDGKTTAEQNFWYFVQFHLDQQMRSAHDYARKHHVVLKGDIPIGISRDGVEAWVEPRYFNLNGQAGAPPDAFAEDGQNWGFPTYNWDVMIKDGCQWWVRRFRKMQEYFDAYRIDHVLGFFRIWEIPMPHKSGLYGQFSPAVPMTVEEIEQRWHLPFREAFYLPDHKALQKALAASGGRQAAADSGQPRVNAWHPRINAPKLEAFAKLDGDEQQRFWDMYNDYFYRRNNQFWYDEAMKKLPLLTQATRMLCCAEDLGMVPDCVPWVMDQLRILSLEIQTMPKDPAVRFGKLSHVPYRSVDTISTHDMSTLRQWWDEDEERTQDFYNTALYRSGKAPHPLPGWLAKDIVSRHLTCPAMLCLLSLQDWLSIDEELRLPDANAERINIPAIPRHYWRYRMHLTIEQLLQASDFNDAVSELINNSGRH